jgi:acyl dehydratase
MPIATLDEIRARVGQVVGISSWITIDQTRINAFADVTEEWQFIHVDAERAAQTPFGGTIAHGFLTLSMISMMGGEVILVPENAKIVINYGLERVRFLAPVGSGKRIRGHFTLDSAEERATGQIMFRHDVSVEIEGEQKPALSAQWISLVLV